MHSMGTQENANVPSPNNRIESPATYCETNECSEGSIGGDGGRAVLVSTAGTSSETVAGGGAARFGAS